MKFRYQKDVWCLLRENISKGQLLGYALANVVGLSVILIGILFYLDSQNNNASDDRYFSSDYIVVSKKVDGIGLKHTYFSEEEIADIERQSWVKKMGRFTSSRFTVYAGIEIGGKVLSTYLFLESVPDDFFDVKPRDWYFEAPDERTVTSGPFQPERLFVPIMLAKDYLTLYNFGFAVPQGLPQLSEDVVGAIPLTLRLSGENNRREYFDAAVVGFSSRLNTIAVPQSFMDWANKHFTSTHKPHQTSRLIIEADRLQSDEMTDYFALHDIEVAGDDGDAGNVASFLRVVSAVVTTNGFVISLLAVFILVLSIFLILQKSHTTLRNLMLLGYRPTDVARYYEKVVVWANIFITIIALAATLLARQVWTPPLDAIGLGHASIAPVIIMAAIYLLGITAFDIFIIRTRLKQIWRKA